jgi:hypothetical protein
MSHEFTYPKVTEIRRVSLAIARRPVPPARPGRNPTPLPAPAVGRP